MNIYLPYYDRGNFHIQEATEKNLRRITDCWMWCNMIYGPYAYTTEEGAQAYIDRRYDISKKYEYTGGSENVR